MFNDNEETIGEYFQRVRKTHPDFVVRSFPEFHEVVLVDELTGALRERFGMYDRLWKAERAARKYQMWAEADRWS